MSSSSFLLLLALVLLTLLRTCLAKVKFTPEDERSLLLGLGLTSRPRGVSAARGTQHKSLTDLVPDFLKEQYLRQTGLELESRTSHFREPGLFTSYSNTVQSFPGKRNANKTGFTFRYPRSPDQVLAAIVKVHWEPFVPQHQNPELLKKAKPQFPLRIRDDSGWLLDTKWIRYIDPELDRGWYNLDVLPSLQKEGGGNNDTSMSFTLEVGALRVGKNITLKSGPKGRFTSAYLVVYSEDDRSRSLRTKRNAEQRKKARKKHRRKKNRRNFCKRHELYVDFSVSFFFLSAFRNLPSFFCTQKILPLFFLGSWLE